MKWFYNLKISVKLLSGFILVALIAGGIGVMGLININEVSHLDTELYEKMTAPLGNLVGITDAYLSMRTAVRDAILASNESEELQAETKLNEKSGEFDENLNELAKSLTGGRGEEIVRNLQDAKKGYMSQADQVLAYTKDNKDAEAMAILHGAGAKSAGDFDAALREVRESKLALAKQASGNNNATARNSTIATIVLLILGMLIAIALGIFISSSINRPVKKLVEAADRLAVGDIEVSVEAKTKDEIGELMASFGKMIQNIRGQAEEANKIALGELDIEVKAKSDKDVLSKSLKLVAETIRGIIAEMEHMSKQHDAGDIDVFVPEEKFQGSYRVMAKGVNDMVKGHISVKKKAMACVAEFAKGNFNAEMEKFPGKRAFINENIEAMRKNLKDVSSEINKLISASQEGKLSERGNAQAFQGDWAELIKGLNGLMHAIIEPIQEASAVLEEMSNGNLQTSVKGNYKGDYAKIKDALNDTISTLVSYVSEISSVLTEMSNGNLVVGINGDYRGDFSEIKTSLNLIIKSFNDILNDMSSAAQQVASGSRQVSDSAQALSQGSTEQASSIEELTASIEEISAQTKQNAANASQANELGLSAKNDAERGNEQMNAMLKAMDEINDASGNISKIIKVIDEIAFQTNILALNAAVEAARAGQHGKGFAVVAEEVRNLAARSANAAKETTTLIEGSIKKVEGGTRIANETANALNKIVGGIAKAATLVGDIAIASDEQATAISQINQGIMQVSQVVQTNSATSEESAAASEELSSQAEILKEMVGKFRLKKGSNAINSLDELNPDVLTMLEDMNLRKRSNQRTGNERTEAGAARPRKIALSDREFGKYR